MTLRDYYLALGCNFRDPQETIEGAYQWSKGWYEADAVPDQLREIIDEAHSVLSNPESKRKYNVALITAAIEAHVRIDPLPANCPPERVMRRVLNALD